MVVFLPAGSLRLLLFRLTPTGIGIVFLHGLAECFGLLAQFPLINNAILVHDKRHHAGRAVFGGIGHEREALGHSAVHDVALCATGSILPLARQNMKEIPTIRSRRRVFAFYVALGDGGSDQRSDRALGLALGNLPIKAIVLAVITVDLLG